MIDGIVLVRLWEDAIEHILDYEEPEEIDGALIKRDAVEYDAALTPALRARVEAADREFISIRPALVDRFPDEFNPKYSNATEEEWWWWPDRVPAELANSHP